MSIVGPSENLINYKHLSWLFAHLWDLQFLLKMFLYFCVCPFCFLCFFCLSFSFFVNCYALLDTIIIPSLIRFFLSGGGQPLASALLILDCTWWYLNEPVHQLYTHPSIHLVYTHPSIHLVCTLPSIHLVHTHPSIHLVSINSSIHPSSQYKLIHSSMYINLVYSHPSDQSVYTPNLYSSNHLLCLY